MSGCDKRNKPSSSSNSSGKQSISLSQLLKSSKPNLNTDRGGKKALPSLEDLQRRLTGNQQSDAKLNLSRALSLNPGDSSLAFDEKPGNRLSSLKFDGDNIDSKLNGGFGAKFNLKNAQRNLKTKNDGRFGSKIKQEALGHFDSATDIEKIVEKIEKSKSVFFEQETDEDTKKFIDFHHIRLPKHFNPFRGHVNVYRSGMIEVVNKDSSEKYRFKQAAFNSENLIDKLVLLNDTLQLIEPINILVSDTIIKDKP